MSFTGETNFLVTASEDGHVKFWKKTQKGVEFVKHFRAHLGAISGLAVSYDGQLCCTVSESDKTIKARPRSIHTDVHLDFAAL